MLIALLRPALAPYRRQVALLVLLQLVQTVATLYLPTLNADIIDHGVITGDTGYILRTGGWMLAVTLVQIVCAGGAVYYGAETAMGVGRDLRGQLFGHVQTLSAREVAAFGAPSLITRTTNDVQQVQQLTLMTFTLVVAAPITLVGSVVLALRIDVPLALLLVLVAPVLAVVISLIVRRMRPQFRLMQGRIDTVNRVLREQITGIRVIRAFVRDDYEQERFSGANSGVRDVSISVGRLMALMFPTVMVIVNITSVLVIWVGGHQINNGAMEVGALTAFLAYLMQILMAVMMATFMFVMYPRAEVCAERIHEVLDTQSSVPLDADPVTDLSASGVELRAAEFRYPGAEAPVISDVSLVAPPGQTTAVIGSTGSGKTTLLHLFPRLFDATAGEVLVGGVDVRRIEPALLARTVSLVPQKPYLFSGTVASNLRYGRPDATDEELWHALEVAQAASFVRELDGQLEAAIAQGGTNVSGGQRQRLSIARAVVTRPAVYLFDDSFSALDYATDAALRAALGRETASAAVVIVAQRVSTIRQADRIVVLESGRVVGSGTHEQLMDDCGTYREIVLSQLTAEEAA